MRVRWSWLIAGGVLVLAVIVVMSVSSTPKPPRVTLLFKDNVCGLTLYTLQISNLTTQPYKFTARMEYQTNGAWEHAKPHEHQRILPPSGQDFFMLWKPTQSSWRLAVFYNRRSGTTFERWRETLRMRAGINPHGHAVYIHLPE